MPDRTDDVQQTQPLPPEPLPESTPAPPHTLPTPDMPEQTPTPPSKHPLKSKTVWGLLAFVLGLLATALDWPEGSFAFLGDGVQLADVGAILAVLGYAWKEYGKRTAASTLTTFFGNDRPQR